MAGSTSLTGRRLQLSRIMVLSTTHMIEMSRGIGEDVPLSPFDILTRIAAPRNIRYTVWSHWLSRKSAAGDSLRPLASPAGINMVRLISAIALAPGWRSRVSTNRRRTVDVPGSAPAALTRVGRRATDLGLPRQNGALSILEKTELRISQSMSAKSTGKPTPKRARSRGAAPAHIDCPGSFGTKPRTA